MRFVKPDWENSILGVTASIAAHLGCPNGKPTIRELSEELGKGYRSVVFLILDGLGMHPMQRNLAKDSFLRSHLARALTSVFPSTTTNATTSFRTGLYPMEHGWFGWSLYFGDVGRCVDLFPCVDSMTGEPLGSDFTERRLPTSSFYLHTSGEREVSVVVPRYWEGNERNKFIWRDTDEMFSLIGEICSQAGKQFVYAYCDLPDGVMHRYGVSSSEAERTIASLNDGLEKLSSRLKDTLFVVTADHGQTDVSEAIEIYRDGDILPLLACKPYLEARATAFRVKEGCRERFWERFNEKYGGDFRLMETERLIGEGYFGRDRGREHAALLGDFIAVGTGDKIMRLTPRGHDFKGHHTSLSAEEMEVPLILIKT